VKFDIREPRRFGQRGRIYRHLHRNHQLRPAAELTYTRTGRSASGPPERPLPSPPVAKRTNGNLVVPMGDPTKLSRHAADRCRGKPRSSAACSPSLDLRA
jgi:hypothetical protein